VPDRKVMATLVTQSIIAPQGCLRCHSARASASCRLNTSGHSGPGTDSWQPCRNSL